MVVFVVVGTAPDFWEYVFKTAGGMYCCIYCKPKTFDDDY
jgi:hypothetical protein